MNDKDFQLQDQIVPPDYPKIIQIFETIYNSTRGTPFSFLSDGYTHGIMSVPLGQNTNIQTMTYSLNGVHTLILYNPDENIIGASCNGKYLDNQKLTDLLTLILTNYEHTQSNRSN